MLSFVLGCFDAFVREAEAASARVVAFSIPGEPFPWPRTTPSIRRRRDGRPFVSLHNAPAYEAHKQRIALFGSMARGRAMVAHAHDGPCVVALRFATTRSKRAAADLWSTKPDIDNLEKTIFDALNGVLWRDDARISHVVKTKILVDANPRTDIACVFL